MEAVLFDLGNTLVNYYKSEEFEPILSDCVNEVCKYLDDEGLEHDKSGVFGRAKTFNREREDLSIYPLSERLVKIFSLDEKETSQFMNDLQTRFLSPIFQIAKPNKEAIEILKELKNRQYATALVSNTPWGSPSILWWTEIERHGLTRYLDDVVFCVDVGKRKPHPAIFNYALKRLNKKASKSIFVGDDPKCDVYGSKKVGMKPILLNPESDIERSDCIVINSLKELLKHV